MTANAQAPVRHLGRCTSIVVSLSLGLAATVACRSSGDDDARSAGRAKTPSDAPVGATRDASFGESSSPGTANREPDAADAASYSRALMLESKDAYHEAVAVYDELLAHDPNYRDANERRATLRAFIDLAEEAYARVLAADSPAAELESLRLIRSFWPGYEDVEQRAERLGEPVRPSKRSTGPR